MAYRKESKVSTSNSESHTPDRANSNGNAATTPTPNRVPLKASLKPLREKKSTLGTIMAMRAKSKRPLPTQTGDGTYRQVTTRPGLRQDLRTIGWGDFKTLVETVSHKIKGQTQEDDKAMLMERIIQLVATLPNHSKTQEVLTNGFIDKLWNSLDHPPLLYMGNQFKYRIPDGSNNNPLMPKLGAAGQPYSRTCKPKVAKIGALPDPELVYESVMARGEFKKNPNNVSSILWYWATIIIHDLFWTNMKDGNINDASSYLDLAPLYGGTQEAQNGIRTFSDGLLKPDCFADKRLVGNPPGVCILLIMFNRFHNHVAKQLALINEGGRFTKPTSAYDPASAEWKKYDDELFQTARLVTSGLYINITLVDYVRNIINLNRVDTEWTLDPRQEMGTAVGTEAGSESGVGNVVSAEFNLCYRWHSCISEADDKWIQDFYKELLGEDYGPMDMSALMKAVKVLESSVHKDPGQRTFNGFQRGPDGSFNDDELVEALAFAIEQPGGSFGARNVPRIMKPIEMLGILRGRRWNLAGLNEFRKHFGLKAYETFEDINSDPQVSGALRNLYQHPDFVELYPGIVAEERKEPMVPGVGIAPTYTISRVVLSDAVSLVRGDRYYTTDYHPGYLTNWGLKEASYDLKLNHGCVFYKLFTRAFPNHFAPDSVYAHYPMVIPSENRMILDNLGRSHLFSFDRPSGQLPRRVHVSSFTAAEHILQNPEVYIPFDVQAFSALLGEGSASRFMMSGGATAHAAQCGVLDSTITTHPSWKTSVRNFYADVCKRLVTEKSYVLAGKRSMDVVRDLGNMAQTHFVARLFGLPLKSAMNPKGVYSEQELHRALSVLFGSLFYDADPVEAYPLRQEAKKVVADLGKVVETNVKLATSFGIKGLFTGSKSGEGVAKFGADLVKGLVKTGLSAKDVALSQVLPLAAALTCQQGEAFAQALDYYLSPAGASHMATIARIASQEPDELSDAALLGYALEGIRLSGAFGQYRQSTTTETISEDGGVQTPINAGDHVFVAFGAVAAKDPSRFPNPEAVDPRRPTDAYVHFGVGPHTWLGREVAHVALTELFRAVFGGMKGVRRVPERGLE